MSDDVTYAAWKKAFTMHEEGQLVNPDTQQEFIKDHEEAKEIRKAAHVWAQIVLTILVTVLKH